MVPCLRLNPQLNLLGVGVCLLSTVYCLLLLLAVNCAKEGFPPGGPTDKSPPGVLWTIPRADSVNVEVDSDIKIGFSEGMDRRSAESSIIVSPDPGDLIFDWRRNTLKVSVLEGLYDDRTYLVTVGTGARDERRNPMEQPYVFAFSTGKRLAQGKMNGRIKRIYSRFPVLVLAYELGSSVDSVSNVDSVRIRDPDPSRDQPDYVTEAGRNGEYSFERIGTGNYRTFAFEDRDKDKRYDPGSEKLGVPPGDVALGEEGGVVKVGEFHLSLRDSTGPLILSLRAVDAGRVLIRFNEKVDISGAEFENLGNLDLFESYVDPKDSSSVYILTGVQEEAVEYRVNVQGIKDSNGNQAVEDTFLFVGSRKDDRKNPEVISIYPDSGASNVFPESDLEVIFSEAMQKVELDSRFWLGSQPDIPLDGTFSWQGNLTLKFSPLEGWAEGKSYTLHGDAGRLSDRAGNALDDSLLSFSFTVIDKKDLGSMSGRVIVGDSLKAKFYLRATSVEKSKEAYSLRDAKEGDYVWEGLPSGRYVVSAFMDRDGNGKQGYGQAFPFITSEPVASYPDTVAIRPRWETSGVDIKFDSN